MTVELKPKELVYLPKLLLSQNAILSCENEIFWERLRKKYDAPTESDRHRDFWPVIKDS